MQNVKYVVRIGGRDYSVQIDPGGSVRLDGHPEPVRLVPVGNGDSYRVWVGDDLVRVTVSDAAGTRWVFAEGRVYEAEVAPAGQRRRASPGHHEALISPMPATVLKLHARPGQPVRRGDLLLVLEAMKMELPVRAPGDGTITAVRCREGELVQAGAPLVELD